LKWTTLMADAPMAAAEGKLNRHQIMLIAMLAPVVMFEGFDISLSSVVLPFLAKDYGAPADLLGRALAIVATGAIVACFLIRLADRVGRRPILLLSSAGFALASLATVATGSVASYAVVQFIARIMLVTQIATSYLMVSETLPSHIRGRVNGVLGSLGSLGAALPFLLLATATESPLGWRLLFVIGSGPLLMLPFMLWKLPETPIWLATRGKCVPRPSLLAELRSLWAPTLRRRFLAMSTLWFLVNFASANAALFFTLYVMRERAWPASDLALLAPFGLAGAFAGSIITGLLLDAIGRRYTIALLMGLLGGLTMVAYQAHGWWTIGASFIGIQIVLGVWIAAYTVNSELFPTELRAAANGWCNNLIGRWGFVVAPWLSGALAQATGGVGDANAALGTLALLAVPLALLVLPETRGIRLDHLA
jgi:putative MFS transporter